jgi:tRNA threonylcarbamoyladenosine modification (KEOPS) complex  Pcc1 subunit
MREQKLIFSSAAEQIFRWIHLEARTHETQKHEADLAINNNCMIMNCHFHVDAAVQRAMIASKSPELD